MLKRIALERPEDYFRKLGERSPRGVYFCRLNGYSREVRRFLERYYEAARLSGVILEGKLTNPDHVQLAYYQEMMGTEFRLEEAFIRNRLRKWLPRMGNAAGETIAGSLFRVLCALQQEGKTESILRNAYIKFMCWMYYRFERILPLLGSETIPKILGEGTVSQYEMVLLGVLNEAGCDILLVRAGSLEEYRMVDPDGSRTQELVFPSMQPFPPDFRLKQIEEQLQERLRREQLYGGDPEVSGCTNAWMSGNIFEDIRRDPSGRGSEPKVYYNCFCRVRGVEDKTTFEEQLYQLQQDLRQTGRRMAIVSGQMGTPTVDEIDRIQKRGSTANVWQLIASLGTNISVAGTELLQKLLKKAFAEELLEENRKHPENLAKLNSQGVYLLCWLRRYQSQLLTGWSMPETGCFFYLGSCRSENEALFLTFLAKLPVDVVLFQPDRTQTSVLNSEQLYEVNYPESMELDVFPEEGSLLRVGTVAYHAQRELDGMLYQNTGLYRDRQYQKANSVCLKTMSEEIPVLWDQELKYRPNFSVSGDIVSMPVIFSKISGIKDGRPGPYWDLIRSLNTPETRIITSVPHLTSSSPNPMRSHAVSFLKNKRLQKEVIRRHPDYAYGFLREEMQEYLFSKIQLLLDQRLIRGTFENGTEYVIIATALNLDRDLIRSLQNFDFTKKNPKLIYVIPGETKLSLEDTIYTAFLNLVGFDILFFVPTGYQCVETWFQKKVVEEHQAGNYIYDLTVPDLSAPAQPRPFSWRDLFLGYGKDR